MMKYKDKSYKKTGKHKHVKVKSMTNISDELYTHLCTLERTKKSSRNSQQKIIDYRDFPTEFNKIKKKKVFISKTIEVENPKSTKIRVKETDRERLTRNRNTNLQKSSSTVAQDNRVYKLIKTDRSKKNGNKKNNTSYRNLVDRRMYFYDNEGEMTDNYYLNNKKQIDDNLEVAHKNNDYTNFHNINNNIKNNYHDIYFGLDEDIEEEIDRVFSKGIQSLKESETDLLNKIGKKAKKNSEKKLENIPEKKFENLPEKKAENKAPIIKVVKFKKDKKENKTDRYQENIDDNKKEERKSKNKSKTIEIKWPSELGSISSTPNKTKPNIEKEKEKEEENQDESEDVGFYNNNKKYIKNEEKEKEKVKEQNKKNNKNNKNKKLLFIQEHNVNIFYEGEDKKDEQYPEERKDERKETIELKMDESKNEESKNDEINKINNDEKNDENNEKSIIHLENFDDFEKNINEKSIIHFENLNESEIKDNEGKELKFSMSNSIRKNYHNLTERQERIKEEEKNKMEKKAYVKLYQSLKKTNKSKNNKIGNLLEPAPKIKLAKTIKKVNMLNRAFFNSYKRIHSDEQREIEKEKQKNEEELLKIRESRKKRDINTYEIYENEIEGGYTGFILLKQEQGRNVLQIKLEESLQEINKLLKNNNIEIDGGPIEIIHSEELKKLRNRAKINEKEVTYTINEDEICSDIETNEIPQMPQIPQLSQIPEKKEIKEDALAVMKKKTIQNDAVQGMVERLKIKEMKERIQKYKNELKRGDNDDSMNLRTLRLSYRLNNNNYAEKKLRDMAKKLDAIDNIKSSFGNIQRKPTVGAKNYYFLNKSPRKEENKRFKESLGRKQLNTINENENTVKREKNDEKERKDKSYSRAMDRFKKRFKKDNSVEPRTTKKSDKINEMAKRLENVMGKSSDNRYENKGSTDNYTERKREYNFEEIIESKPVVKKQKKKLKKFEL